MDDDWCRVSFSCQFSTDTTNILPFFNTGQASKKCTDFNTKFLFSDIFPVVTVLVIFLNSNNLSVLSSVSMYRHILHSSRRRIPRSQIQRAIDLSLVEQDLLDRSVGSRVGGGVAHHLVSLLRVAGMVRGHVVLLAGVGTVGVAVALGRGRSHRSLQVGRLVLGQCRLPSETGGDSISKRFVLE